ncbi:MAG: hypothetical protein JSV20_05665 [Candidatus Bathyarchaeota archaeon]|nr:MAG: hypothetical protein JSV20_05665 [Candidatus Bathyarchaeota archaeon]
MKSFIKIYGPPVFEALKALEGIATESPKTAIVSYARLILRKEIEVDLISKSGETLGEHDFYFEWAREPTYQELDDLIKKIDEALRPLGCKYTIITK